MVAPYVDRCMRTHTEVYSPYIIFPPEFWRGCFLGGHFCLMVEPSLCRYIPYGVQKIWTQVIHFLECIKRLLFHFVREEQLFLWFALYPISCSAVSFSGFPWFIPYLLVALRSVSEEFSSCMVLFLRLLLYERTSFWISASGEVLRPKEPSMLGVDTQVWSRLPIYSMQWSLPTLCIKQFQRMCHLYLLLFYKFIFLSSVCPSSLTNSVLQHQKKFTYGIAPWVCLNY